MRKPGTNSEILAPVARFFKPFVGKDYWCGIKGKKVLVIGASFYCSKRACPYFSQCTSLDLKNSSPFDGLCPAYLKTGKNLSKEPSYVVEEAPRTYKNFAKCLMGVLGTDDYVRVWDHLSFTNYIQYFLPATGKGFRTTTFSDASERDFSAFLETLEEIDPDIVIVWGSVINQYVIYQNPYVVDVNDAEKNEGYLFHLNYPKLSHMVLLVNSYHPSSYAWFADLPKLEDIIKNIL